MGIAERIVSVAVRHAGAATAALFALTLAAGWFAVTHFAMTSDTGALLAPGLAFRTHEQAFDRAFPQTTDLVVVVVDGASPERSNAAAAVLARRLAATPALFRTVRRPDAGAFFDRFGLLLLPPAELQATADRLIAAQPFLGPLAADPSLRGVADGLSTALDGVAAGSASLASLAAPMAKFDAALGAAVAGRPADFSWASLVGTGTRAARRFILVQPRLDTGALEPGAAASDRIRDLAAGLGVRVRLTGPVPLADEEFASLGENAGAIALAMLVAVVGLLWAATRSAAMIVAILVTTIAGLVVTAALGLAVVGRFNLISVAFIPLFVGLGIDFGIQFCVRARAELGSGVAPALAATARALGTSLVLAAAATAAGFFAFLPTDYVGVSELGVIAGLGMLVALALTLTLLPALLALLRPAGGAGEGGFAPFATLGRWVESRRRAVLLGSAVAAVAGLALLPWLRFDFNPLHLRNPSSESMRTLADLMRDPDQSPNTIDVLTPSPAAAAALAARLDRLPEVRATATLASFAPADQSAARAILDDTAQLLDTVLTPFDPRPAPSDAEVVASLRAAAAKLRAVAGPPRSASPPPPPAAGEKPLDPPPLQGELSPQATEGAVAARRLAATLDALAAAPPAARTRAAAMLLPGLERLFAQLRRLLVPGPLTGADVPAELRRDWQTPDGRARVQVFPRAQDNAALSAFADAVQAVAPNANGTPISIRQSGRTIVHAFIVAGLLSLAAIVALLWGVLRRPRDVALTLAPILLAGTLTMATCVVTGLALNFANIIALPLMFGIGVAFHIYLIMAWRRGETRLLDTALARGVLFSALTTGIAFGSLALSHHPGTASMGVLLMISLGWTLVAALVFKPALLATFHPVT